MRHISHLAQIYTKIDFKPKKYKIRQNNIFPVYQKNVNILLKQFKITGSISFLFIDKIYFRNLYIILKLKSPEKQNVLFGRSLINIMRCTNRLLPIF